MSKLTQIILAPVKTKGISIHNLSTHNISQLCKRSGLSRESIERLARNGCIDIQPTTKHQRSKLTIR
jgi:hypothetical protein